MEQEEQELIRYEGNDGKRGGKERERRERGVRKNTRSDRRIGGVRGGLQWSVASAYDKSYVCSIDWLDWLRLGARLRGTHPDNQSDTHPWGDLEPGLILVVLSCDFAVVVNQNRQCTNNNI
jgi:hypothetical protein